MPFAPPGLLIAVLGHQCVYCGKYQATWRAEMTPRHTAACNISEKLSDVCSCGAWPAFGYWCNATCHANWGTNRPMRGNADLPDNADFADLPARLPKLL